MRIAVVGTGISGLGAAWLLAPKHDVRVFERENRVGGHTHTRQVDGPRGSVAVDSGFIVYNETTYPLLTTLFEALGVRSQPIDMSFSFECERCRVVYSGLGIGGVFADPVNALRPGFLRFLGMIGRFNAARHVLLRRIPRVPLLWPAAAMAWLAHRARSNTLSGSRHNITKHYDLGNDFVALFLDPSMTYSCAYFGEDVLAVDARAHAPGDFAEPSRGKPEGPERSAWGRQASRIDLGTLEGAQRAKYRLLATKAGLRPGSHVLEIGCGWGGFAEVAASEFGCRVTGLTISREQAAYARERMVRAGLADRVSIEQVDYRKVTGMYDCVVSIEMAEAVGHRYLPAYFRKCDEVLKPGGRAVIQVITIPDNRYLRYRLRPDFIQRFIFPGAHLPSLGAMRRALRRTALRIVGREDLAPHYGPTLAVWRERLLEQRNALSDLGFDKSFLRRWEFYFAYCEAAFRTRYVADWQLVLERKGETVK